MHEAAAAKAVKLDRWCKALDKTWATLIAEVCVKTIAKEDLKRWNAALQAESKAIEWAECGEDNDVSDDKEAIVMKQKVVEDKEDSKGEEDGEEEVAAKKAKFEQGGLLEFDGPVSL